MLVPWCRAQGPGASPGARRLSPPTSATPEDSGCSGVVPGFPACRLGEYHRGHVQGKGRERKPGTWTGGGKSALVPGCPSSRQGRRLGGRPGEACELGGAASLEARLSWEGEPCTWHRREMPPSAPPGVRAGVARAAPERSPREAGACSSGRRGVLPGGDHTAGLARGRGEGTAGVARGMAGRRGMAGTRGSPGARGPRHPGRPPSGGGLPSQAEAGGRPRDLLPAGGQGALPLGPDSWAGERGPRDAGAARARVCRGGSRGAARLEPGARGRRTSGSPAEPRLARTPGEGGGEPPEAASVGGAAPAGGDAGGPRSPRAGRPSGRSAPGSERGRSREEGGGRASAGTRRLRLPQRGGGRPGAGRREGATRGAPRPRVTQPRPPPGAGARPGPRCRFLREPRLGGGVGGGGRGGRLRSRRRPGAHWRAVGGGARGPSPARRGRGPGLRK